jgi:hypothetical protein
MRAGESHQPSIAVGEGYGICKETPAIATTSADGRQRKLECPRGVELSAMIVKIARTASDGIWTLTQTITEDKTGNLDGWGPMLRTPVRGGIMGMALGSQATRRPIRVLLHSTGSVW